ncbi:MAG: L-aspartate oxidase [Flavobacteriaceae bacterium]|mgnify:FL=1|nr:L-aspartate oxidase [Flavobacteriaceae bacterium]|tara:strand:- start:674 stop:2227 length:1554 start_codon:yes stop_codon:yes gene_type:complete
MTKDVLVIGTGISGLTYAIHVAEENSNVSIVLISKSDINEGNTRYAQGGIAVVSNFKKDSFKKHINDTITAGAGSCDPEVVKFVIEEGHQRVNELIEWGAQFDKKRKQLDLAKEAGHSEKRIVHYKDQTGQQIQEALIAKIKTYPNIELLELHTLVDLITDHHSKEKANRCYGAYVISQEEEKIKKITSKITVLSTGGAGSLFAHSTNPEIATGDGLGAAYRARVLMEGLPYVQFHPTALHPKVKGHTFLITEAVRGAGGKLFNMKGERFMLKNDSRAELAPRDIVARGIQKEIENQKEEFIWLDGSAIDKKQWRAHFPTILETCKNLGIELPEEPIPIVPAAHYFCGGIKVNEKSESQLRGLYAIGECSSTGLHGSNRLASNSLLESLVFAQRAAKDTILKLKGKLPNNAFYTGIPQWNGDVYSNSIEIQAIKKYRKELQELMTKYVGIFKTNYGLKIAEKRIDQIYKAVNTIYNNNKLTYGLCELRNMVSIAYLITKQSQEISQNQGVFYNHDYA